MNVKARNKTNYPRRKCMIEFDPKEKKTVSVNKEEKKKFEEDFHFAVLEEKTVEVEAEEESDEFVCDECGEAFDSSKGLKLHKTKIHGGE